MSPKDSESGKGEVEQRRSTRTPCRPRVLNLALDPSASPKFRRATSPSPDSSKGNKSDSENRPSTAAPKVTGRKSTKDRTKRADEKRRKPKKLSLTLFTTAATVKTRPSLTLTIQRNYARKYVVRKIKELKKETKTCFRMLINELGELEDNLMKRLGLVSNLKLDDDADDALVERKYRVISELEEKVLAVQKLEAKKQTELSELRPRLHGQHGRFVCCDVCEKEGKDKGQRKKKR